MAAARCHELIGCGCCEPRAAHTQWMTNGNGAPVWIDVRGIVRDPELTQDRKPLMRKLR
jgi:hypothetical protein